MSVGCKACPYADMEALRAPHETATREALQLRLQESQKLRNVSLVQQAVFSKSLTLYRSYRVHGCLGPVSPSVFPTPSPDDAESDWLMRLRQIRRGHDPKLTCDGRLIFDYDQAGQAFVRPRLDGLRDHLFTYTPGGGLYDTEYLEALFDEDTDTIRRFEVAAQEAGYGPLTSCTHVTNHTSIRVNCPSEHRAADGSLDLGTMVRLPCEATFRCFEPLEEFRAACPRVLIVCKNVHAHPIPLPTKTPPSIRREVMDLLLTIKQDLPDITPRRFLRHSVTRTYLNSRLPTIENPCLSDLHISLANREHIKAYITQVQSKYFPFGTGWKGLCHLKNEQDNTKPPEAHYIRYMAEIPLNGLPVYDDDEPEPPNPSDKMLRIIICMTPESSRRLAAAQYLQSDIAFKRVSGFLEFEIGGLDRNTNIAVPYCRVFVNRQSAAAHALVFAKVEQIVQLDTGAPLKWRHIHANSLDDHTGILQWAGDQHAGQAKGLGLHLKSLAAALPQWKCDLHEPERPLSSLSEYDHLRRIFRLCSVHVERKIDACHVPESVKRKMCSLICVTHPDFEGTIRNIAREGGKKGAGDHFVTEHITYRTLIHSFSDWVQDKIRCRFAFPGICWEKSYIPKVIWQAADSTTNTLETLHADVNSEGKFCSLLGGVEKGRYFDSMKLRSLARNLASEDEHINAANKRLKTTHDGVLEATARLQQAKSHPRDGRYAEQVARAEKQMGTAEASYAKALASSIEAKGKGSGRVGLLLPSSEAAKIMHKGS
ncbi:hypothetical protein HWV62_31541 [Athelia sp. TMB]|nr:hypothetical protein HWV62_31541 [Athelia sp. TMB]